MALPGIKAPNSYSADCPGLLLKLSDYAAFNPALVVDAPTLIGRTGAFASPFYAPYRSARKPQFMRGENGKIVGVTMIVKKRKTSSDLDNPATIDVCAGGSAPSAYHTDSISWSPAQTSFSVKFTHNEFERTCVMGETARLDEIMSYLNAALVDHETKLIAQLIAGSGGNVQGSIAAGGYRTLEILDSNGNIKNNGLRQFMIDLAKNRVNGKGTMALFSVSNPLWWTDKLQDIGCCNEKGVDQARSAAALGGIAGFVGEQVETALTTASAPDAARSAILFHPGSAHLLEYFRFEGQEGAGEGYEGPYIKDTEIGTTWIDPIYGTKWDVQGKFDCGVWNLNFSKQSMIYTYPTDTDDGDLDGINGIMLYNLSEEEALKVQNIIDPSFANGVAANLDFDVISGQSIQEVRVFADTGSASSTAATLQSGSTYRVSLTYGSAGVVRPRAVVSLVNGQSATFELGPLTVS